MKTPLALVALLTLATPAHALPIYDTTGTMLIDAQGVTVCCWGPLATIQPVATIQPIATVLPVITTTLPFFLTESAIVLFTDPDDPPLAHSPEPGTILLLGSALAALGWRVRRRATR